MRTTRSRISNIKLIVDGSMTAAVLMLLTLALTGLAVHEWLGIALIGVVTLHLLLNWAWMVAGVRRFFGPMSPLVRFNAVLNSLLFCLMTVVLASGLLISAVALRTLGLRIVPSVFLRLVHQVSADALLLAVGIHIGMNWRGVITPLRKILAAPLARGFGHIAAFHSARRSTGHRT